MIRRTLLVSGLLLLLTPSLAPGREDPRPVAHVAQDCWCVRAFADTFTASYNKNATAMRRAYYEAMTPWLGYWRTRVRVKIYDYERTGDLNESWCKRHPKWCKAVRACLAAGGIAVAGAVSEDGHLSKREAAAAGAACGTAAFNAILTP